MIDYKAMREFKRENIQCPFSFHSSIKEKFTKEKCEDLFFPKHKEFVSFTKNMDFLDEQESIITSTLKDKFHTIVKKFYPKFFLDLNRKLTISRKGLAFVSTQNINPDHLMFFMFIFPKEIIPVFASGFILKVVPKKETNNFKYVVNFDEFFFEKKGIFDDMNI